jgi:hypothetical protein
MIKVDNKYMHRVDSLLSCLKHRHGSTMDKIGELQEIEYLASIARDYTEAVQPKIKIIQRECHLSKGKYYYALHVMTGQFDSRGEIGITLQMSDSHYNRLLHALTGVDEESHDAPEMETFLKSIFLEA